MEMECCRPLVADGGIAQQRFTLTTFFFSLSQHSGGVLLPLGQLHGDRLADLCSSSGLFPADVFWICRPGDPHRTHLGSRIQTLWLQHLFIKSFYIYLKFPNLVNSF